MVAQVVNYSFVPATKKVTLKDVQVVDTSRIQYIINTTRNVTLYDYTNPTTITTDGTNVVTVSTSTAGMVYTDELFISYDFFFESGAIALETDGIENTDQSKLNLISGTNITLTPDGIGGVTIDASSSGSGDVVGPGSSTNDNIVFFSGTTGKIIKDNGSVWSDKQDTLVSGTNIKTINSTSLLGSGDIVISGSGLTQEQVEGLI